MRRDQSETSLAKQNYNGFVFISPPSRASQRHGMCVDDISCRSPALVDVRKYVGCCDAEFACPAMLRAW